MFIFFINGKHKEANKKMNYIRENWVPLAPIKQYLNKEDGQVYMILNSWESITSNLTSQSAHEFSQWRVWFNTTFKSLKMKEHMLSISET